MAEAPPSSSYDDGDDGPDTFASLVPRRWRRLLQRDETAERFDTSDVTLSTWVKVRSALTLLLIVVGLAAIVGGALSVIVVGLGLLVT